MPRKKPCKLMPLTKSRDKPAPTDNPPLQTTHLIKYHLLDTLEEPSQKVCGKLGASDTRGHERESFPTKDHSRLFVFIGLLWPCRSLSSVAVPYYKLFLKHLIRQS